MFVSQKQSWAMKAWSEFQLTGFLGYHSGTGEDFSLLGCDAT
jgi:hypothetical protein